jgi:hypothetical protein
MEIQNYSKDGLEIIKQSDFLVEKDWKAVEQMSKELQSAFEKKQIWRTETEMRVSVLNDLRFPTKASKYWQAVREQSVFFENLVLLSFEYRRNNVEIKKIQKKLENEKDELEIELLNIDLEEKMFAKKNMEIASKDRVRELKLWSKIKGELKDGSFNSNDVNDHQLVSYTQSFIKQKMTIGDSGNPSERRNLDGQLISSLKECEKKGLLNKVIEPFNDNTKNNIRGLLT